MTSRLSSSMRQSQCPRFPLAFDVTNAPRQWEQLLIDRGHELRGGR